MSIDTQAVLAVAGVCVLAVALIVVGRRRRKADGPAVEAVVVEEPGTLVLARTHDGTQYQGTLAAVDADDASAAYLTLTGPILFRRADGAPAAMPPAWDRLSLPRRDVAEVWTRSAPVAETPAPAAPVVAPTSSAATSSAEDAVARLRDGGVDGGGDEASSRGSRSRRHARRERRAKASTP
jgi:hypothetical protein